MPQAPAFPKWIWDLVIALQQHEDQHAQNSPCHDRVLHLVPTDVRDQATAIRSYASLAASDSLMKQAERLWDGMTNTLTPEPPPEEAEPGQP